jgi:hypothetical protein
MASDMRKTFLLVGLLFTLAALLLACEIDTKLTVRGGNPPRFFMTGNGVLTSIRVRGPHRQRDIDGGARWLYWVIEIHDRQGRAD